MKGIIYSTVVQNKALIIVSAAAFVVFAAAAAIIVSVIGDEIVVYQLPLLLLAMVPSLIISAVTNKGLERDLKSGFTKYTLCATTRKAFFSALLVMSLAVTAFSILTPIGICYTANLVNPLAMSSGTICLGVVVSLCSAAFTWVQLPLTLRFKSEEKSGLVVMILAVVAAFALIAFNRDEFFGRENTDLSDIADINTVLITIGITATLYIVGSVMLHKELEGGDCC